MLVDLHASLATQNHNDNVSAPGFIQLNFPQNFFKYKVECVITVNQPLTCDIVVTVTCVSP